MIAEDDWLETPNFLTSQAQVADWFGGHTHRMSAFYEWQRRRLGILIEGGEPVGGRWSFDKDNRKKLPRGYHVPAVARPGDGGVERHGP